MVGCGGPETAAEKEDAARKDPVVQALNKTGLAYTQHIDAKGVAKKWRGIGIRIEDDLLVTETGARMLGKPIPKTIQEVEEILKR